MHQKTQKQCPRHSSNSLMHQSLFGMSPQRKGYTIAPPMTAESYPQNTGYMRSPREMRTIPESKWYKLKLLRPSKIQPGKWYKS